LNIPNNNDLDIDKNSTEGKVFDGPIIQIKYYVVILSKTIQNKTMLEEQKISTSISIASIYCTSSGFATYLSHFRKNDVLGDGEKPMLTR
jgi:hypothetical protein